MKDIFKIVVVKMLSLGIASEFHHNHVNVTRDLVRLSKLPVINPDSAGIHFRRQMSIPAMQEQTYFQCVDQ